MNKKVLRWNFVFQYGWVITNVINSFVLFPVYIHYIKPDTLGVWVATSSILGWMMLTDPGIGEVLQQKIAEMRGARQSRLERGTYSSPEELQQENTELGRSIGSGFMASAIILLLAVVVGLGCYFSAGALVNKDISRYPNLALALLISIIATGMQLVSFTVSSINQGLHNSAHVAIASLTANVVFLVVNLVFLYAGLGVMSIALANLTRSLYINVFNFASLLGLLKRENTAVRYQGQHFKKFIRIFSFTSASKIISGLAGGLDMLLLARYIAPSQITYYELNKRPVLQSNSLIGRHSVALMPLVSHAKGTGNRAYITGLIDRQFKLYCYAVAFAAFMFIITYKDLLILWTGEGTFLGYPVLLLLVSSSITGLMGYFLSNMDYAVGDIKANSKFWMLKNIVYASCIYFGAKFYGIMGTLTVALGLSVIGELAFFSYRNIRLGYLDAARFRNMLLKLVLTILMGAAACWGTLQLINTIVPAGKHLVKLLAGASLFTVYYLAYVLVSDSEVRTLALDVKNKVVYNPMVQKIKLWGRRKPEETAKGMS